MTDNTESTDLYRRRFFGKAAGVISAGVVAPGVLLHAVAQARNSDEAVTDANRWGMLIDANKCADDCNACVTACDNEHGLTDFGRPETDPRWIRKVKLKNKVTNRVTTMPMMCQHCETAPCVDVCPTGASFKRDDGIVLVDRHTCIGCRYCMMACPYKARSFVHEVLEDQLVTAPRGKGCVESCTLCVHKIDAGDNNTACAEACAAEGHEAILFGDLKDPDSKLVKQLEKHASRQLRADLALNPGVRYSGI